MYGLTNKRAPAYIHVHLYVHVYEHMWASASCGAGEGAAYSVLNRSFGCGALRHSSARSARERSDLERARGPGWAPRGKNVYRTLERAHLVVWSVKV